MANRTIYFLAGFMVLVAIGAGVFAFKGRSKGTGDSLETQLALARKEGLPLEPKDLRPKPVAAKDNAGPIYRKVFPAFTLAARTNSQLNTICSNLQRGKFVPPGDIETVKGALGKLRKQLDLVESASRRPHCDFGYDYSEGFDLQMPEFAPSRTVVRLLCARAHFDVEADRYSDALQHLSTSMRFARHIGEGPMIIAILVQLSQEQMVLTELRFMLKRARGNRRVLDSIGTFLTKLGPLPDVRKTCGTEVVMGRVSLQKVRTMGQLKELSGGRPESDSTPLPAALRESFESTLIENWRRAYEVLGALEKSWPKPAMLDKLDTDLEANKSPSNVVSLIMMPSFSTIVGAVYKLETGRRLAECSRRIFLHRLTKGSYPASMPNFGKTSTDPFVEATFRYKRGANGFVVYSVGVDGKDEGGAPMRTGLLGDIAWSFQ